jgi:hypothetical protein
MMRLNCLGKKIQFQARLTNLFLLGPAIAISLSLLVLFIFPTDEKVISTRISILFIYTVLRINVSPTLVSG